MTGIECATQQPREADPSAAHRPLEGRVAVVTGAGRGLGGAIAAALARAGADLALCDIDETALAQCEQNVLATGARCAAWRCDVSDSADVQALFERITARFGTVHILVNNAALVPSRSADEQRRNVHYTYLTTPVPRTSLCFTSEISDDEWHRWWGVNVHGVFYCTREALKRMQPQRWGRIVNIASIAGLSAMSAHSPHYSATKGAVIAFTKAVAAEVAGANILVNAVAPGGVHTPDFAAYLARASDEQRNRLWQMIPLGRLGAMEEYAATVVHLAGEHYLVGQVLSPNGGAVI